MGKTAKKTKAEEKPSIQAEALQKFVMDNDRFEDLKKQVAALKTSVEEQEAGLIAQFKDGALVPEAFAVAIKVTKKRNISWKSAHAGLCVAEGLVVEVEQKKVWEATPETPTESLLVSRR